MESLFGEQFNINENKTQIKDLINKISTPKDIETDVDVNKKLNSKKLPLNEKLNIIKENVFKVLGKQRNNILVITSLEDFSSYIDKAIQKGIIALDTETNNTLDYINCKLMGLCLYVSGEKQTYIPINHINNETGKILDNQLTEKDVRDQLQRLVDNNVKIIYHNAKFDYQVIKCTCGIELPIYWDTMIASRLLDENEHSAGLKQQYIDKIDSSQEKYSIDHLFENVLYEQVDPEIFAFYAATDSYMTYKLYEWQKHRFEYDKLDNIYKLFMEVELPCIKVTAEMELNGIELDIPYSERLLAKYSNKLKLVDDKINLELSTIKPKIDKWRLTPEANEKPKKKSGDGEGKSKTEQLEENINLGSPTQLAILLYDILKCPIIDKKTPRGTGEEILTALSSKLPLASLLLQRRGLAKLINAFLESLPQEVNKKDGRIHCHFNQLGTDTGRFSSSGPNLQQIPSHNKEIRMMFKARDGYTLIGSDFSQQEPRLLSFYSQDENMINSYKEGKDLYATIAMGVYHMSYWDCMEHFEDGSPNPEGKKRRSSVKSLLLGIMYGRGVKSIAEQINGTVEEAQEIIDNFYKSFPTVKSWMDKSLSELRHNGYVEDFYGRRRRLNDIFLDPYVITYKDVNTNKNHVKGFNPLLECDDRIDFDPLIKYYHDQCLKSKSNKELDVLKEEASKKGIIIQANTGRIAQAERQCVNAKIQGGAATMTKIAMIKLFKDKELNDLGFKLCIGVHDELIGECPKENADKAAERLTTVMKTCVSDIVNVPFKCDADIADSWYLNDYHDVTLEEYHSYLETMSEDQAKEKIFTEHCECTREFLTNLLFSEGE